MSLRGGAAAARHPGASAPGSPRGRCDSRGPWSSGSCGQGCARGSLSASPGGTPAARLTRRVLGRAPRSGRAPTGPRAGRPLAAPRGPGVPARPPRNLDARACAPAPGLGCPEDRAAGGGQEPAPTETMRHQATQKLEESRSRSAGEAGPAFTAGEVLPETVWLEQSLRLRRETTLRLLGSEWKDILNALSAF